MYVCDVKDWYWNFVWHLPDKLR